MAPSIPEETVRYLAVMTKMPSTTYVKTLAKKTESQLNHASEYNYQYSRNRVGRGANCMTSTEATSKIQTMGTRAGQLAPFFWSGCAHTSGVWSHFIVNSKV